MTNILIAITAYIIDKIFGEFKFFRHPVEYIKDMIFWFERSYYEDSFVRGVYLIIFMVGSIGFIGIVIEEYLSYFSTLFTILISSFVASMFISYKTLQEFLKEMLHKGDKHTFQKYFSEYEIGEVEQNKLYALSLELFAKNLNNKVIAPIFYLLLFGIPGILIYKTVKTTDVYVGYKTKKYTLYGKATALLDDVLNYIPSRITATLIMLFSSQKDLFSFYEEGQKHESPNAGHPLKALAIALDIELKKRKNTFEYIETNISQNQLENALRLFCK